MFFSKTNFHSSSYSKHTSKNAAFCQEFTVYEWCHCTITCCQSKSSTNTSLPVGQIKPFDCLFWCGTIIMICFQKYRLALPPNNHWQLLTDQLKWNLLSEFSKVKCSVCLTCQIVYYFGKACLHDSFVCWV